MPRSSPTCRPSASKRGACCPLAVAPPSLPEAEALATRFRALADPARLRLLGLIQAQPDGEACVCNLVEPLGLAQPTVTHHLQVLHRAGLLRREKRGIWVYYQVERAALQALRETLA